MTGPKRLIEEGTEFDRELLRAGREDRPSSEYERRVIAAAALGTAGVSGALVRPPFFARILRPHYLAMLAMGVGAATFSSTMIERGASTASTPASAAESAPSEVTYAMPVAPSVEEEPSVPVMTPHALPSAPVAAASAATRSAGTTPRPAQAAAPAPAASVESLEREVELLDGVKRSLRAGELAASERALDAYDSEFPAGTLKPEAGFLRIRLLLARGERARATALGDELLARHPNSVHAKRIRAVLAAPNDGSVEHPNGTQAPPR